MTYTVQNQDVYAAAFAGAMSGMKNSNPANSIIEVGSTAVASAVADAFAQELDTLWGSSKVPTIFDIPAIQSSSSSIWYNRILQTYKNIVPSMFVVECANIIQTIADCDTTIEEDGITLPPYGGTTELTPVCPLVATAFTQPAVSSNVDVEINTAGWINANVTSGENIYIVEGGWYQVISTADPVMTLENLGGPLNTDPGYSISVGTQILPPNIDPNSVPTSMAFVTSDITAPGTWGSFSSPIATASVYVQAGQVVRLSASVNTLIDNTSGPSFMRMGIWYEGEDLSNPTIAGGSCWEDINTATYGTTKSFATLAIDTIDITVETSGIVTYILVGVADSGSYTPVNIEDYTFSAETINPD
jgi:hypothetical protein